MSSCTKIYIRLIWDALQNVNGRTNDILENLKCMHEMKISKQDNQRNAVAEKCQSSSKEGQPTQVSLKCESVSADEHTRENVKEKNQKLT